MISLISFNIFNPEFPACLHLTSGANAKELTAMAEQPSQKTSIIAILNYKPTFIN